MTQDYSTITLQAASSLAVRTLWQAGHGDADWPKNLRSWRSFFDFSEAYQALAVLNLGELKIVERKIGDDTTSPLGFVLLNRIDPTWLPDGTSAVECGTYLLPHHRGTGVNLLVKTALLACANQAYHTDFAVFTVAQSNVRAQRAMAKLPWEFYGEGPGDTGPFTRYVRRKSFEAGEPCELYAVELSGVFSTL